MTSRLNRAQVLSNGLNSSASLGAERKINELYSDFATSFARTPVGDTVSKFTDEKSINQSLKNIILTNFGERLYNPGFGSNINALLFENNFENIISTMNFYIRNSIQIFEKRVEIIDVIIEPSENENSVTINIVYRTSMSREIQSFSYILKRVR